jgi:hypothetical protein
MADRVEQEDTRLVVRPSDYERGCADERRKVIAELREQLEQPQDPTDPLVVRKIQDVMWSHSGASPRITAYAIGRHLAPLLASLLAPEGGYETENAQNISADSVPAKSAITPASPSPEPARARRSVAVHVYDLGAEQAHDREEGSTHG